MFDFLKRKKKEEPQYEYNYGCEYPQDQDGGRTVPLVPGYEDPLAGSAEVPVPVWNGGAAEGGNSDTWYGPVGGGYGIPMDMPAGIPAMPPKPECGEQATVAEPPAVTDVSNMGFDSTIAEVTPKQDSVQDYGSTVPLIKEPEMPAGIPAMEYSGIPPMDEPPRNDFENDNPTVGLPPYIVGQDSFVRVDSYTGPSLMGEKGVLAGKKFSFRASVTTLGVDFGCDIVLPLGTPGISRRHLRFWLDGQTPCAMDLKSTYGSFLNGEKMKPGLVYNLKPGDHMKLGGDEEFRVG